MIAAAGTEWAYRVLAVLVLAVIALSMEISAIQKQAQGQAEQRFMFKVGDEMAERRFKAFKRNRQVVEGVTSFALALVVLVLVVRVIGSD